MEWRVPTEEEYRAFFNYNLEVVKKRCTRYSCPADGSCCPLPIRQICSTTLAEPVLFCWSINLQTRVVSYL